MRRAPLRSRIVAGFLLLCFVSCGFLIYSLSTLYRTEPADELAVQVRSCTDSMYHLQYCLGLVPTVPSMYPSLYHSTESP